MYRIKLLKHVPETRMWAPFFGKGSVAIQFMAYSKKKYVSRYTVLSIKLIFHFVIKYLLMKVQKNFNF